MKKTELLIPVGNMETLKYAISNGADAVYLGGKRFGARAYSNNFGEEELIEAINYAHLYSVKVYVTVNTMIYNQEVNEVLEYLNFLYTNNVDAVIMQDIGLISLTRKELPNLCIHVSTQAHNYDKSCVEYYKKIGCKRVVYAREMSLNEINNIKIDIEKEVFVYGALCICYSGNCLFSALNGGRSANRGMCVGSCRLAYKLEKNKEIVDKGFLLSTKDLNTINNLKELLDSNITSLKIEGRMKSKYYVAMITRIHRKLIDNYYAKKELSITEEEKENLLKIYNREFTNGYIFNSNDIINKKTSNHQGIKIGKIIDANKKKITIKLYKNLNQGDAIRIYNVNKGMYVNCLYDKNNLLKKEIKAGEICSINNKDNLNYRDIINSDILKTIDFKLEQNLDILPEKKIPVIFKVIAKINKNLFLEISDRKNIVKITGNTIKESINSPTSKERIITQLTKLGNTPYILKNINIECDQNIFINIKELNSIRREGIAKLNALRIGKPKQKRKTNLINYKTENVIKPKYSILVRNETQLKIVLNYNFDYIYVTSEKLYNKYKDNTKIYLRLERVGLINKKYKNERLLCTSFNLAVKYASNNMIKTDYYLNIANDYSLDLLKKIGAESSTISVENNIETLKLLNKRKNTEIIIYGTLESMIIKNNIFKIKDEITYLIDKNNNKHPVIYENNYTHIFNHEKIDLRDNLDFLKEYGIIRIELFNETEKEIKKIINSIMN